MREHAVVAGEPGDLLVHAYAFLRKARALARKREERAQPRGKRQRASVNARADPAMSGVPTGFDIRAH